MLMAAAVFALTLAACSHKSQNSQTAEETTDSVSNSKVLVAYFSASGVTEGVAKQLAEVTGGDLHQIQPEQPYTEADLDWRDKQSRSTLEMGDKAFRPLIAKKVWNINEYDTVFVGFPIWWYVAPTIVNTFLENNDMRGKKLAFFATSGTSGLGDTVKELSPSCPFSEIIGAKRFAADAPAEELGAWAKEIMPAE